ncbi:MAG: hypothetical protein V1819_02965 [bacterium]
MENIVLDAKTFIPVKEDSKEKEVAKIAEITKTMKERYGERNVSFLITDGGVACLIKASGFEEFKRVPIIKNTDMYGAPIGWYEDN